MVTSFLRTFGCRLSVIGVIATVITTPVRADDDALARIVYPRPVAVKAQRPASPVTEPRSGRRFTVVVRVEAERAGLPETRFIMYAPDESMRPLAVRVARFMALLWAYADSRFRVLNPRLRSGQAQVWICRDGEGGAEQSRDAIYLYDAMADRSDIEWARTLAHEYGHYLLPGPAGYVEPEPWSNGLLGERLFLGWLYEDVREGRLSPDDAVFVDADTAAEYHAKQVAPLVERVRRRGIDRALLADRGRAGMDEAIGLLLYAARLHGDSALADMLEWLPTRTGRQAGGVDYLQGYESWLGGAEMIRQNPPAVHAHTKGGERIVYMAYVPAGVWRVSASGVHTMKVEACAVAAQGGGYRVRAPAAGWRRIEMDLTAPEARPEIVWIKSGSP